MRLVPWVGLRAQRSDRTGRFAQRLIETGEVERLRGLSRDRALSALDDICTEWGKAAGEYERQVREGRVYLVPVRFDEQCVRDCFVDLWFEYEEYRRSLSALRARPAEGAIEFLQAHPRLRNWHMVIVEHRGKLSVLRNHIPVPMTGRQLNSLACQLRDVDEERLGLTCRAIVCYRCGEPWSEFLGHIDHVIPLIEGGAHHLDNLALICARCNSSKGWSMPVFPLARTGATGRWADGLEAVTA